MNSVMDERSGDERRQDFSIDRANIPIAKASAVIAVIVGLLVTYFASVNTVNARVSVLETQRQSDKEQSQRIEVKVDKLDEKMERLLDRPIAK